MATQEEYLEETYGPAARYAEHQRGDTITYREIETDETKTGKIIWICAPGRIGDREIGITYVVEPPGGGCAANTSSIVILPWHIGQSLTPLC